MMAYSSTLSQDEVDALLAHVTGKDDPAQAPGDTPANGVRSYDLSSPDRIVRHRMQTLELIHERFVRRLRPALFSFMRRGADVTVQAMRVQKYADFERNLPVPGNLNMVTLKPLRGTSLFTFDPNLIFLIIESVFGGNGRYRTRVEGRDFTSTEQRIIRRLMQLTLECYAEAWQSTYPIDCEYVRSEMHTKFARIGTSNDAVVVATFRIELGSSGGLLNICLPYSMLEPIRDLLTQTLQQHTADIVDQRWARQLAHEVRSAEVEMVVEFARIETTIAQLLHLGVGHVLPLDLPATVTARVGGVPILQCGYGTSAGHYALSVQRKLASENDLAPLSSPVQA